MSDRPYILLKRLAACAAIMFILLYLVVAACRMSYPYELEWMEGGMLQHVHRILNGLPLYVPPSLEFTPFIYPPFYYYASAATTMLFPDGFVPLRAVSILASLGCFVLIYLLVQRETHEREPALLAAGLYAATFVASGSWFDIARVDSLFMMLTLGGVYALWRGNNVRWQLVAGFLLTLAFLTKQIAPIVIAPIALCWFYQRRRQSLPFILTVAGGIVGTTLLLNVTSDGWFMYYMVWLPQQHDSLESVHLTFWIQDIMSPLFIAAAVGAAGIWQLFRQSARSDAIRIMAMILGLALASYFSRVHSGGYDNVLMPAYAAVAILFGIGLPRVRNRLCSIEGASSRSALLLLSAACLLQYATLTYNPVCQIPKAVDEEAGKALVRAIASYEGEVLVGGPGYLAEQVGKTAYAHQAALVDIVRSHDSVERALLIGEMNHAMSTQQFDAVFQDWAVWHLPESLHDYYEVADHAFLGKKAYPIVGHPGRPQLVYIPREDVMETNDGPNRNE